MAWAIVQIVFFMILGLVIVIGGVAFGLPYLITKAAGHDQATCDCWDCRNRRHRAVEKAKARQAKQHTRPQARISRTGVDYVPEENVKDPNDYWSTEELRSGYHVFVKGVVYEVGLIRGLPDGNTQVNLRNILTKGSTMVIITRRMRQIKMWQKGFGQDLWR